jgi:hypothetical protein
MCYQTLGEGYSLQRQVIIELEQIPMYFNYNLVPAGFKSYRTTTTPPVDDGILQLKSYDSIVIKRRISAYRIC